MTKLDELNNQGFTIFKKAFPIEMADEVIKDYYSNISIWGENIQRFRKANGRYMRLANFHNISKSTQELFSFPKELQDLCSGFFSKKDISIYTSLFFQEGTEQDLHRDAPLFCTYPENKFLGCWFALEDTNKSNGSLSVIPRGHKIIEEEDLIREQTSNYFYSLYPQKEIGFSEQELWIKYQQLVQLKCKEKGLKSTTLNVSKGDIIVWHPMLPHGGSPIKNPLSTRHSIVFHVVPNQMRVYGNDLFFLKNKFNSFLEPPTSIQIKNSLYIQEQSCGFTDEGVDNKDMNFLSSKIKKLRNKKTKIKDKFFLKNL